MATTATIPDIVERLSKAASAATLNANMDRKQGFPASAAVFDQYASLLEESAAKIRQLRQAAEESDREAADR